MNGGIDDIELELRLLPGVLAVGFQSACETVTVELWAAGGAAAGTILRQAEVVLASHADTPPMVATVVFDFDDAPTITLD